MPLAAAEVNAASAAATSDAVDVELNPAWLRFKQHYEVCVFYAHVGQKQASVNIGDKPICTDIPFIYVTILIEGLIDRSQGETCNGNKHILDICEDRQWLVEHSICVYIVFIRRLESGDQIIWALKAVELNYAANHILVAISKPLIPTNREWQFRDFKATKVRAIKRIEPNFESDLSGETKWHPFNSIYHCGCFHECAYQAFSNLSVCSFDPPVTGARGAPLDGAAPGAVLIASAARDSDCGPTRTLKASNVATIIIRRNSRNMKMRSTIVGQTASGRAACIRRCIDVLKTISRRSTAENTYRSTIGVRTGRRATIYGFIAFSA